MYDVEMEGSDDEYETMVILDRKRTLNEQDVNVERQLKKLKINHLAGSKSPSTNSITINHIQHENQEHYDVNYEYANQLLRELHYLRIMRKHAILQMTMDQL